MPAGLPGATLAQNSNPTQGPLVIFDLLSGPKGSPFDKDAAGNYSTGGLSTGIGYGSPPVLDPISNSLVSNSLLGIRSAGFDDDDTPGQTKLDGTATTNSTYMYIGGGRSLANADATSNPYTAGYGIGAAGNGAARDAGAGPAFTGFPLKMVTATGAVANAAAVETGFQNRSGLPMVSGQSVFGASTTASAAVA
jgi:hypothetical protein